MSEQKPRDLSAVEQEARRRRLAEVFGDVLPEQTSDDKDERDSNGKGDDWYRDQVPPHHG